MSRYDYEASGRIVNDDPPFYALIMAAMRNADTPNLAKLQAAWPQVYTELKDRYNAPGGVLDSDADADAPNHVIVEVGPDA